MTLQLLKVRDSEFEGDRKRTTRSFGTWRWPSLRFFSGSAVADIATDWTKVLADDYGTMIIVVWSLLSSPDHLDHN